jgi:hypothetical protein
MATANDTEERVLNIVREHWAGANVQRVEINQRFEDFLRGTLYAVSIYDADNQEQENYVLSRGDELRLFRDVGELVLGVGRFSSFGDTILQLGISGLIAGVIALGITFTLCGFALRHPENLHVVDMLANTLLAIVGFFLGTKVRKDPTARVVGMSTTGRRRSRL